MADQEEKPIRVVDRRMFTADGELRPGLDLEETPEPAARAAPPPPPPQGEPAKSDPSPGAPREPKTTFGALVVGSLPTLTRHWVFFRTRPAVHTPIWRSRGR